MVASRSGLCGLATCFGASTVMLGSAAAEPVAVCDTAVPLGPNSNAVDRIATAEGTAKLDDNRMRCPPIRDGHAVLMRVRFHPYSRNFRTRPPGAEKIPADDLGGRKVETPQPECSADNDAAKTLPMGALHTSRRNSSMPGFRSTQLIADFF